MSKMVRIDPEFGHWVIDVDEVAEIFIPKTSARSVNLVYKNNSQGSQIDFTSSQYALQAYRDITELMLEW